VPVLYEGEWDNDLVHVSRGKSALADHVREGIVIKPKQERLLEQKRVILKYINEDYLNKDYGDSH